MSDRVLQSVGSGVFTPAGYAAALLRVGSGLKLSVLEAMRRSSKIPRAIAIAQFRTQGIGKRIFGAKASGAYRIIKAGKPALFGELFVMTIRASGMAAIQERGGRFRPHIIKPKNKKILRFAPGRSGSAVEFIGPMEAVFAKQVHHPGATHPAMPFLERAMERAAPRIRAEIDKEVQRLLGKEKVA